MPYGFAVRDGKGECEQTLLSWEAKNGYKGVVKLLLEVFAAE
jgi:hypothetical protein